MKTSTFFALIASAEIASATYNWGGVKPFTCPGNTPVTCEEQQKEGFNWAGLNLGDFSDFGGFQFSGFKCASKFGGGGKRDIITGRTFQDKCITGSAGPDKSSSPKFSCGKSPVPNFSVDELHITPEFDCDLQFHYTMPDKSTCKQTSSCKSSGTVVKNTQCGGATDVTIVYPGGGKGGKPSKCNVGVHHIGFHCSPPKPSKTKTIQTYPVTSPTKSAGTTSVQVGTTTAETTPATSPPVPTYTPGTTTAVSDTTTSTVPGTPETTTSSAATSPPVPTYTPGTTTAVSDTTTSTVPGTSETTTSSAATSPPVPTYTPGTTTAVSDTTTSTVPGTPETTPVTPTSVQVGTTSVTSPPVPTYPPNDVTTTVIKDTTVTTCPFTSTHVTSGTTSIEVGTTVSTVVITSTHTTCNKCTHQATPPAVPTNTPAGEVPTTAPVGEINTTSPPAVPATTPSGTPSPPVIPDVPVVLPQCLSTWMFSSDCADNTDASCYCKSSEYVCNVFDCLGAHATDAEITQASNYLQGICAPYIDVNSAIITCAAAPPADTPQVPIVPSVPQAVTTIQVYTTIVVPCSESGTAIPGSSTTSILSTAVTVPQVVFQTPAGSSSAALVVGTPAPASVPAGVITSELPVATAATTLATIVPSNSTAAPTGSPQFEGASSQLSMTFGTLIGALMVSVLIM